jgi:hypothetical protein
LASSTLVRTLSRRSRRNLLSRLRSELTVVAGLLLAITAVQASAFDHPLLEAHSFRQTQTAYQALEFHEQGVSLFHPKLPVFGEPFEVPFEFPLFQLGAATLMSWGLSPDVALRTTAFLAFLVSALLLYGLVRHLAGPPAAIAALAFYVLSPFAMLWSKASLIEYCAVSGALAWLWGTLLWARNRRLGFLAFATFGGVLSMLVKPTTAFFWALPVTAAMSVASNPSYRLRFLREPTVWLVLGIPFVAALAWTIHADSVKSASEATAWLTTTNLRAWNFGTLQQRLVLDNLITVSARLQDYVTGLPPLLFLLLPLLLRNRIRFWSVWSALLLVPFVTIGVFWNLYVVHDYYLAAVSPVFAAALGLTFCWAWRSSQKRANRVLVIAAGGGLIFSLLVASAGYWRGGFSDYDAGDLQVAKELNRFTSPAELVLFEGYDWSPHIPYYARRRGFMLRANPSPGEAAVAARLSDEGYRFLVTSDLQSDRAIAFLTSHQWTGVLGQWTYMTAESPEQLDRAKAGATNADLSEGGSLIHSASIAVPCTGQTQAVPRGEGVTALHVANAPAGAKIRISASLGPVPSREWLFVSPGADNGPILVSCRDAPEITIDRVYSLVRL